MSEWNERVLLIRPFIKKWELLNIYGHRVEAKKKKKKKTVASLLLITNYYFKHMAYDHVACETQPKTQNLEIN